MIDTTYDYAEDDAVVLEACEGTSYDARPHSHDEVMAHADHVTEFTHLGNTTALCCHTCLILVAY